MGYMITHFGQVSKSMKMLEGSLKEIFCVLCQAMAGNEADRNRQS